jgi:hypothetical protein
VKHKSNVFIALRLKTHVDLFGQRQNKILFRVRFSDSANIKKLLKITILVFNVIQLLFNVGEKF